MRLESQRRTWEEAQVGGEVEGWAVLLRAAGLKEREPVVIEGVSQASALFAILGVRRAGGTPVVLHPGLPDAEALPLVRRVGPRLVVASPHRRWSTGPRVAQAGWEPPTGLALSGASRRLATEYLLFTSGSEGAPKGVLLSEQGFRAHRQASRARLAPSGFDRWLLSLSPAHVGGLAMLLRAQHEPGSTLVCPGPDWTQDVAGTIARHRISHVSLVPTLLRRLVSAGEAADHLRLVLVGGARCPPELAAEAIRKGFPLRLTYGLTEAHSQVATSLPGSPAESVGPPLPDVEVKIEARTGRILVRGPTRLHGYLGRRRLAPDAWFRTGDLGSMDGEGNLWVRGRSDDLIITGGENVDPTEVESALESIPGVAGACVVGEEDPEWGQRLVALIVPAASRPSAASLRRALAARLAPFKVPKRFVYVEQLPRTATGKLRRAFARRLLDGGNVGVHDPAR